MYTHRPNHRMLAICGGPPAFPETLHVGCPNIGNRERLFERINEMLDRRWLTNGGFFVREFERQISEITGVRHCIAMCNGTMALEIAIRALGLTGEVIVPSFTFIATAHALQWQGVRPVFADIDPATHNLDPGKVEMRITPRTTGIVGVHLWGRPCDTGALEEIAGRHNLQLLFDAAHAFGVSNNWKMVGNFGSAEVFSFHATKYLNTFEGGAVVTNDHELAGKIRLMKNFGFAGYDNVIGIGTNGKMSEICAAMGLANLECLDDFIAICRQNYAAYRRCLSGLPGISLVAYDQKELCNYQYIVVEVDEGQTGLHRDHLMKVLHAENVLARRYFWPGCHRMEPYRSDDPHAGMLLPETEKLAERVLVLPSGTGVGLEDIELIGSILHAAIWNSDEVRGSIERQ
jgi:dTDP-4-amino-4,6-dideoxygalactose transaminase